jgi:acylphosphatase
MARQPLEEICAMRSARKFIVRGLVQGVGYRFFAVRSAERHGIVGTVRNMPDGSVEVIAEGSPAALEAFRKELERGPAHARVTAIEEMEIEPSGRYKRFEVAF